MKELIKRYFRNLIATTSIIAITILILICFMFVSTGQIIKIPSDMNLLRIVVIYLIGMLLLTFFE